MADTVAEDKISKNELKRRMKAEKQAKEKAEKEKLKKDGKLAVSNKNGADQQLNNDDQETLDPNEYFKIRKMFVNQQKEQGLNPYPHKFKVTISLTDFIDKYNSFQPGDVNKEIVECVSGRIHAKRESGSKLIFFDLRAEGNFDLIIIDI